jgi:two-component system osmolarity sensor histidine kinase EnvZ
MKRLLENLLDNAVRYGAEPVEMAAAVNDGQLWLQMRDHGPGIPEAQRAQALEPFVRLDAARSGSGSCGLGLAIVERVARLHGGCVELDAAPGGGLSVRVRIPFRMPSAGRDVSCQSPAAAPSA